MRAQWSLTSETPLASSPGNLTAWTDPEVQTYSAVLRSGNPREITCIIVGLGRDLEPYMLGCTEGSPASLETANHMAVTQS